MRAGLTVLLTIALMTIGCLGASDELESAATPPEVTALPNLVAPTFAAPVDIPLGPATIGGEPSVAVASDGTIYVSAPRISLPERLTGTIDHGHIWRSDDGGASFTLLNDENGRLAGDACGNGDTDLGIDAMDRVYMIDLCGGIPFYKSEDRGATWSSQDEVTQREEGDDTYGRDRQWIDAQGDGHLIIVVAGTEDADVRSIIFVQSRDAGETWDKKQVLATDMIQLGPMVFVNETTYAMPYIEPGTDQGPASRYDGIVHILITRDGGETWANIELERRVNAAASIRSAGWSPTHIFPVLEADPAGNLYLAWSEDNEDHTGSQLVFTRSLDAGMTWDEPEVVSAHPNAIFPWLAVGSEGRVALAYLASETPLEPNRSPGPWYVHQLTTITGAAEKVTWVDARASPEAIHVGGVCQNGGTCMNPLGADGMADRTLLDFFEVAIDPTTGHTVIAYTADPLQEAKQLKVGTVVQQGGTPLLAQFDR